MKQILLFVMLLTLGNLNASAQRGCSCAPPTNLVMTPTSISTGTLTWQNSNLFCDYFRVDIYNVSTGVNTTYYVSGTTFYLTGINFGQEYIARVAAVYTTQPPVECLPAELTFGTVDCGVCHSVENLTVQTLSSTSFTVSWTPIGNCTVNVKFTRNSTCGTQSSTYSTTGSSYTFNNLTPGASYTVEVWQAGGTNCSHAYLDVGTPLRFFDPAYCASNGSLSSVLYLLNVGFAETPGTYTSPTSSSYIPSMGYVQNFSTTIVLNKNKTYFPFLTSCERPHSALPQANVYINLWLDYNNDHVFSSSERVLHGRSNFKTSSSSIPDCSSGCLSWQYTYSGSGPNVGTFTTPNSVLTGITGRFIISTTDVTDACNTNIDGQVNDIIVNIQ